MATFLVIAALLGINVAVYAIGYLSGSGRAAADVDEAFDAGLDFGALRGGDRG